MNLQEKSQYKIYIDTADRKEKRVTLYGQNESKIDELVGDIDVVSTIRDILQKHGIEASMVHEYRVNSGPGSFTGLKIGVTVANVINWALGKKTISEMSLPTYGQEPNIHPTTWLEK
ncbi:hypothetical protein HYV31_00735 [candidate division WWE3 bacterium]|nr:hypothetical protein [candidate division WWE3 bacterium]